MLPDPDFVKFIAAIKVRQTLLVPLLFLLVLDPVSEIHYPGSDFRDPGWEKIRIRDPG